MATPTRTTPSTPTLSVSDEDRQMINGMLSELLSTRLDLDDSNVYYNAEQMMTSLGISIPPHMLQYRTVLGWPRITCDVLDERIEVDSVRGGDDPGADEELDRLWTGNDMESESQLAHLDALVYGRSYATVGSPCCEDCPPSIQAESPYHLFADWDARTRSIKAALRLHELPDGDVGLTLYTPTETVTIACHTPVLGGATHSQWEIISRDEHRLGVVPVVRLVNRQRAGDRTGGSEIIRELRSITDAACRTLLRMAVAGEFYSSPQRYILGADEGAFANADGSTKSAWQVYIGKILAIERDEDGQVPEVGQFSAFDPATFTQEIDLYARTVTALTGMPPHMLGHTTDNPASAEGIRSAEARLVKKAERKAAGFAPSWREVMRLAWMHQHGPDAPTPQIGVNWVDAATPTVAAQADSVLKLVQAGVLPAESDVVLERAGLSAQERQRVRADREMAQGRQALSSVLERMRPRTAPAPGSESPEPGQEQVPGGEEEA